jgi:plastocyanin
MTRTRAATRPLAVALSVAAALLLTLASAHATAATQSVQAQFEAFAPSQLDVLPGESVEWSNVSPRTHTVTSDAGLFDSGELSVGATFTRRFDDVGTFAYHCTIHPQMTGEVDVRRVILAPLPTAAVPAGQRVEISGRTADPTKHVRIQRSLAGDAFTTVASATPAPDGSWSGSLTADTSADVRATDGTNVSQTRHLLVSSRRVRVRATRNGVLVAVTPSAPYARVVLQLDLPERFGWWPVARARLDYLSQARFRVKRPARVRAVLVAKDGWTPLAISPVLVLAHARPTHTGAMHGHHHT